MRRARVPRAGSILKTFLGCLGIGVLLAGAFVLGGFFVAAMFVGTVAYNVAEKEKAPLALIPEVATFLDLHREFGRPTSSVAIADWAHGKRQRVYFDSGRSLLFYRRNGEVMTVYEDNPSQGRQKVWGEYASYEAEPAKPPSPSDETKSIAERAQIKYNDEAFEHRQRERAIKLHDEEEEKEKAAREEAERHRKEVEEASERERVQIEKREAAARAERAATLLRSAENLERLKRTRGALDFYRKVVQECPDTPQAKPAAEKIKALGGK